MASIKLLGLAALLSAVLSIVGSGVAGAAPSVASCTGIFSGTVTSGPDTGFVLQGHITLPAGPHQHLVAVLHQTNGIPVLVTGSEQGNDIELVFHTLHGEVRGSGEMPNSGGACTGNFGGTFRGPALRDKGDWGIIWGS